MTWAKFGHFAIFAYLYLFSALIIFRKKN
uniref:Uncharacterized protein n=1 Tax=mine drainage metagenome TaxID=410659 RepID=E6QNW5_9ZZZZ